MRVALVYPPFFHKAYNENLTIVDQEFGRFPYISYGYIARYLRDAGAEPRLFDAMASGQTYEQVLEALRAFQPAFLGFAAHSIQTFPDMLDWAKRLKQDMGCPVVVGGYEAGRYCDDIMTHSCFDYLCLGDAKPFIGPFLEALEGSRDFASVPGLAFRSGEKLLKTEPAPKLKYQEFGLPDRSIFDHSQYYSHVSQRRHFTIGVSSVGCPYRCSFCCMAGTGYDAKPAEQVFAEILDAYENHGVREFDWFDPLMFFDKKRILDLCAMIQEKRLDLYWSARTRADTLTVKGQPLCPDEAFIEQLGKAGCKRLFVGVESGDIGVLESVRKNLHVDGLKRVFSCAKRHGIRILGFFMVGNPGDTHATVKKTVNLAKSLPLDYAQFSITLMKPGTELAAKYMQESVGFDYWRALVRGEVSERVLPSPWTDLSREEQERLVRGAYFRFYFRPRYIIPALFKIESPRELLRYVRVVVRMVFDGMRDRFRIKVGKVRRWSRLNAVR